MQPEAATPGAAGSTITATGGSIAAGTIMGDAILGPVVQVGGGAMPAPETVAAPPGLHNLPRPPVGVFAGRDALLDRLGDLAAGVGHVLHGLGGVGKSELALHVAHAARDAATVVWWVSAETPETITLGLAELTRRLHPVPTLADAREWALGWLQAHPGWLLVLDNVADPGHVADLLGRVDGLGRVLVTTRRDLGDAVWSRLGLATVPVGPLGRVASVDVLVRLAGRGSGEVAEVVEAARLAADLGDLPLALTQAAAFVAQRGMPFATYRQRLAAQPARMYAATAEGTEAERAVDRVWAVTMESIAERSEHAGSLLTTLSALAAEPVPEEILIAAEFRRDGEEFDIEDAIALLASYSMVGRGDGRVWVHRLVQAVTRARADADALAEAVEEAVTMLRIDLRTRSPEDPADWPRWNELLPHIDALDSHRAEMTDDALSSFGVLRAGSGDYLELQGQSARAIEVYEGMRADWIRLYGEEDRSVVQLANKLALAYKSVGRYDDAIEQLQWAADHVEMDELGLTVGSNLAAAYAAAGHWSDAARILEAVATMFERLCGADDPRTLTVKDNLAVTLLDSGQTERGISLSIDVAASLSRQFGPRDHRTLVARMNAASALSKGEQYAEAVAIMEAARPDLEATFGQDHPQTLMAGYLLATMLRDDGRVAEGVALTAAVLADRLRVLGPDHPQTMSSRNELAAGLLELGRVDEAVAEYRSVLADRERVIGTDHPNTALSRAGLAHALRVASGEA